MAEDEPPSKYKARDGGWLVMVTHTLSLSR